MSVWLNNMIKEYYYMFNNIDKIPEKKNSFIEKYIINRNKIFYELQKEVDIYKLNKSNNNKINKLVELFWSIQTNEIITIKLDKQKEKCCYYSNCYRLNVEHNITKDHFNNVYNNFASKIAIFLGSLDNKIESQRLSRKNALKRKSKNINNYSSNKRKR